MAAFDLICVNYILPQKLFKTMKTAGIGLNSLKSMVLPAKPTANGIAAHGFLISFARIEFIFSRRPFNDDFRIMVKLLKVFCAEMKKTNSM